MKAKASLLALGVLSATACANPTASYDASEAELNGQAVLCDPVVLPGITTRVFRSTTSGSVFYALPEEWHVVKTTSHELFSYENAFTDSAIDAAATSPFYKQLYLRYRFKWTTSDSNEAIVAALRAQTGLPTVTLKELTSIAPPKMEATFAADAADIVSVKTTFPGSEIETTVLTRNFTTAFSGSESNKLFVASAQRIGITGAHRSFSYQCAEDEGAAAVARPLVVTSGVASLVPGADIAPNELRFDSAGIEMFNDVDAPRFAIDALNQLDGIDDDLARTPAGAAVKANSDAYLAAGWNAWRAGAWEQLRSDTTVADRWGSGNVKLDQVRQSARTLRDDLLQVVESVAAASGSALSARDFLKRPTQTVVDARMNFELDALDHLADFQEQHWTHGWE